MSIRKRGPNQYEIVWELGRDPATGKRRQLSERFHGKLGDAKIREVERQKELNEGIGLRTPHLTVNELAAEWLAHKSAQGRKASTVQRYRDMVRDYIGPRLGTTRVADLSALDVQLAVRAWSTQARKDGKDGTVAPRTVHMALQTLSTMLKQAVRWQIVSRNVAEYIEPPARPHHEAQWWTAEDAARFLAAAEGHLYGMVFALALLTGLRKGELLGLRWQDVDLTTGQITVRQAQDHRHPQIFHAPKTHRSLRAIALDADTVGLLVAHQTAQKRQRIAAEYWQDWGLVCTTGLGTPINPSNLDREMRKLITRAGVPRIRFHDLRHTHATLLREQGADLRVIANRLGHAQVHFTAQVYAHASTDAQVAPATQVAQRLLSRPSS